MWSTLEGVADRRDSSTADLNEEPAGTAEQDVTRWIRDVIINTIHENSTQPRRKTRTTKWNSTIPSQYLAITQLQVNLMRIGDPPCSV